MDRYKNTNMRRADAENIYQDVFLAIQENLQKGRIRENTSWSSYIMTVGLNMASKQYRKIGKTDSADESTEDVSEEDFSRIVSKIDRILASMPDESEDLYHNPEVREVLADELIHTPEPCASIIRLKYFMGLSDNEITQQIAKYNSAKAVKAKRWQCMNDLVYRVKAALYIAGIIDVKPEKRNHNGK